MPNFLVLAGGFQAKEGGGILKFSFKFLPNSQKKKEKLSVIREVQISLGFKRG
jgi:hypothetical protein